MDMVWMEIFSKNTVFFFKQRRRKLPYTHGLGLRLLFFVFLLVFICASEHRLCGTTDYLKLLTKLHQLIGTIKEALCATLVHKATKKRLTLHFPLEVEVSFRLPLRC